MIINKCTSGKLKGINTDQRTWNWIRNDVSGKNEIIDGCSDEELSWKMWNLLIGIRTACLQMKNQWIEFWEYASLLLPIAALKPVYILLLGFVISPVQQFVGRIVSFLDWFGEGRKGAEEEGKEGVMIFIPPNKLHHPLPHRSSPFRDVVFALTTYRELQCCVRITLHAQRYACAYLLAGGRSSIVA